jgi:biotin carboxyl carrier protein
MAANDAHPANDPEGQPLQKREKMKYSVKVADQTFEVEIEDINARPVVAKVGDQVFEIMPDNEPRGEIPKTVIPSAALPVGSRSQQMSGNDMVAPLPGTVTEVFVKPGDQIESGQVVLIIEAMKMKNSIRAVRSGTVGQVLVSNGQSVAHKQPLLSFADSGEASWI